jgi:hypothetical protein
VGEAGQIKLLEAKVLLIGAGGLGSPAAMYLARPASARWASSISTWSMSRTCSANCCTATRMSAAPRSSRRGPHPRHQPRCQGRAAQRAADSDNALEIIRDYDIVLNGSDNFPTRYLVNDACHMLGKPLVDGSIFMFEGQVTVYLPRRAGTWHRGRAVLPLPLSRSAGAGRGAELRRGGRAGRAARHRRFDPGHRGDQADPGASASRWSASCCCSTRWT